MTVTWERAVTEVTWESATAPGVTWTTIVGGLVDRCPRTDCSRLHSVTRVRWRRSTTTAPGRSGSTRRVAAVALSIRSTGRPVSWCSVPPMSAPSVRRQVRAALSGNYPNPGLNDEAVQDLVRAMVDGNTETGAALTYDDTNGKLDIAVAYGTSAGTSAQGNDSRLSDARTPTSHASSHASDGSDPLTLAQSQITGLTSDLASKLRWRPRLDWHPDRTDRAAWHRLDTDRDHRVCAGQRTVIQRFLDHVHVDGSLTNAICSQGSRPGGTGRYDQHRPLHGARLHTDGGVDADRRQPRPIGRVFRVAVRPTVRPSPTSITSTGDRCPAQDAFAATIGLTLDAGDVVTVWAANDQLSFSLFGEEAS